MKKKKNQPKLAQPIHVRDLPCRKCNGNTETFKIVKTGKRVQFKCNHATSVVQIILGSILMMLLRIMSELTGHYPENLPAVQYQHHSTCTLVINLTVRALKTLFPQTAEILFLCSYAKNSHFISKYLTCQTHLQLHEFLSISNKLFLIITLLIC